MSIRKPYNDRRGYVASKLHRIGHIRVWTVIYDRTLATDIDADARYVTSCETHGTMIASASVPRARADMKAPAQWCEQCAELVRH